LLQIIKTWLNSSNCYIKSLHEESAPVAHFYQAFQRTVQKPLGTPAQNRLTLTLFICSFLQKNLATKFL